ncbi:right-handed parallel beta-helix repeat-containing protein, partial [Larkinella harenae]
MTFRNYTGQSNAPITIINAGGLVELSTYSSSETGIKFQNCSYFKLSGAGVNNLPYGIKITKTGKMGYGLQVTDKSSECEIERLEISGVGSAGMLIKTDPSCDGSTWQGNFTMQNVKVHHNYIHDVGGEGLYVGHAFGTSGVEITCNGKKQTVYAPTIRRLEINNNLIENTGGEGIRYSSAPDAQVHHNTVRHAGESPSAGLAKDGVLIGGGSGGSFYNNTIRYAAGNGLIMVGHLGENKVYNNVIADAQSHGVFVDERANTPVNAPVWLVNNTIVSSGQDGIRLYNETQVNTLINNAIVKASNNRYITTLNASVRLTQQNNYTAESLDAARFVNASGGDFRPVTGSPLIDAGQNASSYGVTVDLADQPRFKGRAFDIGAFEGEASSQPTEPPKPTEPTKPTEPSGPAGCNCSLTISKSGRYDGQQMPLPPGATICVQAGTYQFLSFRNFKGTAQHPITIINCGGPVTLRSSSNSETSLKVFNSQFFKITGSGVAGLAYGFRIEQTGADASGLQIGEKSSDCEVERVEVAGAGFAG